MVCWAEVAMEHEASNASAQLYELLRPWHDQFVDNGSTTEGPIAHYLGGLATVLGRYRYAQTHFEEALDKCERMEAKFFTARIQLSWARMLKARGKPGDARRIDDLVASSLMTAKKYRYATVARRAEALIGTAPAAGARIPSQTSPTPLRARRS
jgi:hypothetical protein